MEFSLNSPLLRLKKRVNIFFQPWITYHYSSSLKKCLFYVFFKKLPHIKFSSMPHRSFASLWWKCFLLFCAFVIFDNAVCPKKMTDRQKRSAMVLHYTVLNAIYVTFHTMFFVDKNFVPHALEDKFSLPAMGFLAWYRPCCVVVFFPTTSTNRVHLELLFFTPRRDKGVSAIWYTRLLATLEGYFGENILKKLHMKNELIPILFFYCPLVFGQSIWTQGCLTLFRPNKIAVGWPTSGQKIVLDSAQQINDLCRTKANSRMPSNFSKKNTQKRHFSIDDN